MLSVLFIYNTMGYYFVFKIAQFDVRAEMKSAIKRNIPMKDLEVITIPATANGSNDSQTRFIDDNELIYQGKLYDIVKRELSGNNIIVYCINDKKEEVLLENLYAKLTRENDITKNMNDKSGHILTSMIKDVVFSKTIIIISPIGLDINFSSVNNEIINSYSEVITPPPRFSC